MSIDAQKLRALLQEAMPRPWSDDGYRIHGPSKTKDPRDGPVLMEWKHLDEYRYTEGELACAAVNALCELLDVYEAAKK